MGCQGGCRAMTDPGLPPAQGLYDPAHEHDACGVGFVVDIKGRKSHAIVSQALTVLKNLLHRGACGCEVNTGDGAGILIQMPHRFLERECSRLGFTLPAPGHYGAGLVFLPRAEADRAACRAILERMVAEEGQVVLGWRPVPTDSSPIGPTARSVEPAVEQVFIARGPPSPTGPPSSASSTSSASARSTRCGTARSASGSTSTSRASPRTPSSTRACSRPTRSRACSPTSWIPWWNRRWPWCTSGSPPTRSRRGRSRTPTGSSPTTARSTRCGATSTGCGRASRSATPRCWGTTSRRSCRSWWRAAATRRSSTTCSSSW